MSAISFRPISRVLFAVTLLFGIVFSTADSARSPANLSRSLAQFDATVLSQEARQTAARMITQDVQTQLQAANTRSSAEWRNINHPADWAKFRAEKLAALRQSLGPPAPPTPLQPQVTGLVRGVGYQINNILFQSRPGLWITANLYRPETLPPSLPGILIAHAHHTPKEHGELQDMGITWARAGCWVLVIDQLGHGERRQHPFRSAADFARPFQFSRQDYYFRFDAGIQLHLAGESLIGWIAHDLSRGVDLLLAQANIDPDRIILLGAVAGGGDPAAVAAALDPRITAAVPFNFGGPQPETPFPLPDNPEQSFNYAGSGSWESTRNLRRSAADGFLPWVIVGSIAPRPLVYAHEFSWDQNNDPVWKRLQTIYGFYQAADRLAFTHGRGQLRGQPPEATHCTHIGAPHRQLIHAAFKKWFDIDVSIESTNRHPAESLRAMTAAAERELHPKKLRDLLSQLTLEQIENARLQMTGLNLGQRRARCQTDWSRLLGNVTPSTNFQAMISLPPQRVSQHPERSLFIERHVLRVEPSVQVPLLLLIPEKQLIQKPMEPPPVVVAVAQAGKQKLLHARSTEIAALLELGMVVCLPDLRGTGETSLGAARGRRSTATSIAASKLMLGGTLLSDQLRDLRSILAWLRLRDDLDPRTFVLWGDSLAQPNPPETNFQIPRDDDSALPAHAEPLGALLALLTALYEDDVHSVFVQGGLASFHSILAEPLVLVPADAIVPSALTVGDLCDLTSALAPRPVRLEGLVDGWNRPLSATDLTLAYKSTVDTYRNAGAPANFSHATTRTSPALWLSTHRKE